MKPHRVVIVGGGVIGLSLAWELLRRGVKVTLIDRGAFGQATSWAAAGILPPANRHTSTDPLDQLRGLSHEIYPAWCQQLQDETGIDSGLRRCGGWYLAETAGERAAMIGMTEYWREMQIVCEPVELSRLKSNEPLLDDWCESASGSPVEKSAWWVPDEYQIRTPRFLQALARACQRSGATMRDHSNVTQIRSDAGRAAALADDQWVEADAVVMCGGAWAGLIDPQFRLQKSVVPIRGQMLLLNTTDPLFRTVINVGQRYLIGRDDGHVLVGSCEEEVGFREGTTDAMLATLRRFADRVCPSLRDAETVTAWSGFRPMTFDGFPMIGRVPEYQNVFVAAGHHRSGIHLAPATAVTLSDLILGNTPPIDLAPFRVGKQQI